MHFKKILIKIISLNFRNYKYIGLFLVMISLTIMALFYEYFFMEENIVYAMKKSKVILNEVQSYKYSYIKKINYSNFFLSHTAPFSENSYFSIIRNTELIRKSKDFYPISSLDILNYKTSFSTFNMNRIPNSLPLIIDLRFNMDLQYLTNNIYFLDQRFVHEKLLPILKYSKIYGDFCDSFRPGLEAHHFLIIYDNLTQKWLIGVCTHSEFFKVCTLGNCGVESNTTLISSIDFTGAAKSQRLRTFIVFENEIINREITNIILNNSISTSFINKNNLYMDKILEMVNSNNFTYINNEDKILIVSNTKGDFLKCCLPFESLFNNYNKK